MDEVNCHAAPFVAMWQAIVKLKDQQRLSPSTLHAAINNVLIHHDAHGLFFVFLNMNTHWDGAILVNTTDPVVYRRANYAFIDHLKQHLCQLEKWRQAVLSQNVIG